MSTDTQPVTGQDIGTASFAIRGLLDDVLAAEGTTFEPWVVLNLLATRGPTFEREALVQALVTGIRAEPNAIRQLVGQLELVGLVRPAADGGVELSPTGVARFEQLRDAVARLTVELYAPFDRTDLAITRRVLVELTERATAWRAAAGAPKATAS
jgi:hypothetical protein